MAKIKRTELPLGRHGIHLRQFAGLGPLYLRCPASFELIFLNETSLISWPFSCLSAFDLAAN